MHSYTKPAVNLLESDSAHIAYLLPGFACGFATRLQVHDSEPGLLLEHLIVIESLLRSLVELLQIADIGKFVLEVGIHLLHVLDEHAKLGAPIADVVEPVHLMSAKLQDSACRLANDGRTKMANVHLLRNVWRREVNNHTLARGVLILDLIVNVDDGLYLLLQPVWIQRNGDEARTTDADLVDQDQIIFRQALRDGVPNSDSVGHVEGFAMVLENAHRIVALVVPKLGISRDKDDLLLDLWESGTQRLSKEAAHLLLHGSHRRHCCARLEVRRVRIPKKCCQKLQN